MAERSAIFPIGLPNGMSAVFPMGLPRVPPDAPAGARGLVAAAGGVASRMGSLSGTTRGSIPGGKRTRVHTMAVSLSASWVSAGAMMAEEAEPEAEVEMEGVGAEPGRGREVPRRLIRAADRLPTDAGARVRVEAGVNAEVAEAVAVAVAVAEAASGL